MPGIDATRVARDIADLRIQVNALEVAAKPESLPVLLRETRSTVRWSAAVIAIALVVSSLVKYCNDNRVEHLEKCIEALEKYHAVPASS